MTVQYHSAMRARENIRRIPWAAAFTVLLCVFSFWGSLPGITATASAAGAQGQAKQPQFQPDVKKAKEAYKRGVEAEEKQDWPTALLEFTDAVNFAPTNHDYLMQRENARSHLVRQKSEKAEKDAVSGRLVQALRELREARELDPTNTVIRDRISELSALLPASTDRQQAEPQIASPMHLSYTPGRKTFDLRGNVEAAYEETARQFGVEAAFDVDIVPRQIRLHVDSLNFLEAMDLIGQATGTFWRPLTPRLFYVSPDTPQKRKDYDASVVKTIRVPSAENSEQMTELLRAVREISGLTRTELDSQTGTLTLRGSPRAIAIASGMVENLDQPGGEVILEIEVLQVDSNYARTLGITPPQTATVRTITPQQLTEAEQSVAGLVSVLEQLFGTPSSLSGLTNTQIGSLLSSGQLGAGTLIPPIVAFGGGMTTFFSTLPGASAELSNMLSLVRSGQRIILRAEDGKPATFFVGDRVPVSLGQFSASLEGGASSLSGVTSQDFPTTNLTTGAGPEFVATADLRSMSRNDLIVANGTDNTLSVFLSNGDGTFENAITPLPLTGKDPVWIATGSFNNSSSAPSPDTFPDLAVADQGANTVSIFLGNGDGTFQPRVDLPTGIGPDSVVTANFHDNSNTNLDLAVANFNDNTISVYAGNGDGTFQPPTQLVTGFGPSALVTGDFNGDGHQDIAVTNKAGNTVSIFLGNGDGTFRNRVDNPTGQGPVWVSTGDFRGVGILDLAVANNTDNTVSVLLGNGDGTFGAQTAYSAGGAPTSIAVADYNIDGRLDMLVSDANDNAVSLLLGIGDGTFGPNVELAVGTDPTSVVTADFNGDGRADAAVSNFGSNNATVILNEATFSGNSSLAGTPFPGVQYIDVGVKIKATPRVHPNDEVSLKLSVELSSVTSTNFNGIPVISNQSVEQTVRVHADRPSLLAGIREPSTTTSTNGTPGAATIPGVGALLSNQNLQNMDSQLLILITPHIVSQPSRPDNIIYAGHGGVEGRSGVAGFGEGFNQNQFENERLRQLRGGRGQPGAEAPQPEAPQQPEQQEPQPPGQSQEQAPGQNQGQSPAEENPPQN